MKPKIDTADYERTHGKTPRGRGSWAFCPSFHYNKSNYLEHTFWTPGSTTYATAKRLATAHFTGKAAVIITCT